ncbi:MAG: hypothetical protein MZV65_31550 [Chromatiales bacterium]|nr:hypothetical protein [Chromatiales bacterium]
MMLDACCDPIGGIRLFASTEDVLEIDDRTYLRSGILADADASTSPWSARRSCIRPGCGGHW